MKKNIVLIGFMGTGKSSVGRVLAERLHRPIFDVDAYIEARQTRKIRDIFEKEGEGAFRTLEAEAIGALSQREGCVITTGGGAVLDPRNLEALRRTGWLVALSASPETILGRVKDSSSRPLLKGPDVMGRIRRLLEERRPLYDSADFRFETDGKTPVEVAGMILKNLEGKI